MVTTATQSMRMMERKERTSKRTEKSKNSTTRSRAKGEPMRNPMIQRHQVRKVARMAEVMKRKQTRRTRKTSAQLEKAPETNLPTKSRPRRTSGPLVTRV